MPCRSVAHWIDQVSDSGTGDAPMKVSVKAVDHALGLAPRDDPLDENEVGSAAAIEPTTVQFFLSILGLFCSPARWQDCHH
jgi:hypothetical protein